MNKIFILLFSLLLIGTLYAEDSGTSKDGSKPITVYLDGITTYSDENFFCPKVKSKYFTRIANIQYKQGIIECFVYDKTNPSLRIAKVEGFNERAKTHYLVTPTNDEIDNMTSWYENPKVDSSIIDDIAQHYFVDYVSTGNKEFVNFSRYMIAVLTLDSELINIPQTIAQSTIIMNDEYTLFPNMIKKETSNLGSTIGNVYDATTNWFVQNSIFTSDEYKKQKQSTVEQNTKRRKIEDSVSDKMMLNAFKGVFDSFALFLITFMNEFNIEILSMKTFLAFSIIPFTVVFSAQSIVTKKLSKITNHEDNVEKVLGGLVISFLFFFATTTVETEGEKKISQTFFQNKIRPMLYSGAKFADRTAQASSIAYVKAKIGGLGITNKNEVAKIAIRMKEQQLQKDENFKYLQQCFNVYHVERIRTALKPYLWEEPFFSSEDLETASKLDVEQGNSSLMNFYTIEKNTGWLKNSEDITKDSVPSVSFCYDSYRNVITQRMELKATENQMAKIKQNSSEDRLIKKVEYLAKSQFRINAELGFISMANLATIDVAIDSMNTFDEYEIIDSEAVSEQTRENIDKKLGTDRSMLANSPVADHILQNMVYLTLPFTSSIKDTVKPVVRTAYFAVAKMAGGLSSMISPNPLGKISFIIGKLKTIFSKTGISGFLTADVSKKDDDKVLTRGEAIIINILTFMVSIWIIKLVITSLPIIAMSMATFMVVFWYLLSVEFFYMLIPFMVIFAFANSQVDIVKNFMIKFVVLAFKPVMIVLSVVLAIFAHNFFSTVAEFIIHYQFDQILALNYFGDGVLEDMAQLTGLLDVRYILIKGYLLVGVNILNMFVCFYLVLNGANMIVDILGLSQYHSDAQTNIGSQVDNKGSQWNGAL